MDSKQQIPSDPPPAYAPPAYDAPPGPPPSQSATIPESEPPPYPPPPGIGHRFSNASNATGQEADAASDWCAQYPLTPPFPLSGSQLATIDAQDYNLAISETFKGTFGISNPAYRTWRVTSRSGCTDSLIQTQLPAYSQPAHSPMLTERPRTIYYEVRILSIGAQQPERSSGNRFGKMFARSNANEDAGVAIGFFAPPYPPFRLPGWQRGSLGVHSDDGRRYVGNDHGGMDFTAPFKAGETVGLGMTFDVARNYDSKAGPQMDVEVFFTRDGRKVGGWNLSRDTDAASEQIVGLQGEHDIFPAIGVFGPVDVEVNFGEQTWLYRGWNARA